jgi:transcription-repair coupling factor (superfamily II helicase)
MALSELIQWLEPASQQVVQELKPGAQIPPLGLRRSARLPVLGAIYQLLKAPIFLLTGRSDRALTLLDELSLWIPDAPRWMFPEPTPLFYEDAPWGVTTRRDRLVVLTALAAYHVPGSSLPDPPPVIVAPARAVMTRTIPRREFLRASKVYKLNQLVQPEEMVRGWVHLGYEPVNTVVSPGQFARRGGILDVWPAADPQPVRVEFFGDEIDTLRRFDPATQRTIRSFERLQITPAREFLVSDNPTLPPLQEGDSYSEFHLPWMHNTFASVLDYLPSQAIVLIDDFDLVSTTVNDVEEQAVNLRQESIREGTLLPDMPVPYLSLVEIQDTLANHTRLDLGGYFHPEEEEDDREASAEESYSADFTPSELASRFSAGVRFGGRLKNLIEHLTRLRGRGEVVTIVSRQTGRLTELWQEQKSPLAPDQAAIAQDPIFIDGSLSEGWSFNPDSGRPFHLLTDGEIFGWRRPEPRKRHRPVAEAPETAYADLKPGDWVVHVDHGIGQFIDLVSRTVEGVEREYLCIEYADGDQLFVPVYQADRLTRYVGPDGRMPSPTRLGGVEWRNAKESVQKAVEEVAEDLLDLYAKRQIVVGHAFASDTPWQKELEASFPYIETDDQLRVLAEVKHDMENVRPMDRLICGDVGYGKTEVALRAAFKAVSDSKQVAILVPTTVLAQQHYHTFRDRLSAFPVEVEMLSRFRSPQQQRDILYRLAQGGIDIIIGTHRLIQGDVLFKDLGLLVIDEEQRFGVTHKETLKRMRTEVDVLTMTATPIPRTLYMTLTGVRDISTINTPPEERLPVVTHVGPYSPRLVRQAILREMERGGQVFFVHNRVQTIGAMRRHLENLVPEARIGIAHGQMPEGDLSHRMDEFTNGDLDILLCTSIIESGLDIPNANTLIVDRADTFGLAQLYQLRGRVGRGAQRAYGYFFRHKRRPPTADGRERLETIAENTQLGAGYSIAMRDLEIRGAGDILGTRQHGHIAAVGFHLYTRLLAEAVRHIRTERNLGPVISETIAKEIRSPVNVDLPIHLGIPQAYVQERDARLRLYRRIADISTLPEVDALIAEFTDRFGAPPESVLNLFYQLKVKILAEKIGILAIGSENGQVVVRFPPLPENQTWRSFPDLGSHVRSGKNSLWLPGTNREDWQELLLSVLERLAEA